MDFALWSCRQSGSHGNCQLSWKNGTRGFLQEWLHYSLGAVPFEEEFIEQEDFKSYIQHKALFNTADGDRVPAYLLVPKELKFSIIGGSGDHE